MSQTHGHNQEAARRNGTRSVIIALTAAFAFGAIDQYLGTLQSSFLTEVSGMSALWLLVPFLAGGWQAGQRSAALVGLAAAWLAVLAYVAMIVSPMEGTHLGPRPADLIGSWNQLSPHLFFVTLASQWLWFVGGVITGPIYGWLGYQWRARGSWATALLAVVPVLLEPVARWLATHIGVGYASTLAFQWADSGPAVIAELAELIVGLVLTAVVVATMARTRTSGYT